eukprot:CAMPEP_0206546868 /NCGR_PEP_ID=MMETSP0325_2-20121206/12977_1 /ASSEMBLY_ACC=CAM_ASM_000347 /TAXON_ID=2866 /ORGANISM="Crypthecodinium cohnii, Strain Seligo" /LENGTH=289 /DNA_ID=CAMNT_0054046105 /DNA_START=173 /DNA_END=1042 /DNA_ORIENTATION=-
MGVAFWWQFLLTWVAAEISSPGINNIYYQVADYFGSRVLEHNVTGRYTTSIEAIWSSHATMDKEGRIWVADRLHHQILLIKPDTRYVHWPSYFYEYAGNRDVLGHYDGVRSQARFNAPMGIALCEPNGELIIYVSDTNNHVVRRLTYATGRVATIAGLAGYSGLRDGIANRVRFDFPMSMGVDIAGENLFVVDNGRRIRHIDVSSTTISVVTLVDGACRGLQRWTVPYAIEMRKVQCHMDWLASNQGDTTLSTFEFDSICIGHQATCGPRQHPAINDLEAPNLVYEEDS